MAKLNFGGVIEEVMTREEFPLEKAREVLKNETIAVWVMAFKVLAKPATFATTASMLLSVSVKAKPMTKP